MKLQTLILVSLAALGSIVAFGQSTFKGLTPGTSTRADVERVLGRPVKQISPTLVEYTPQPLTGRIFVQYGDGSLIHRIEFICRSQTSTCSDLIRNLKLSSLDSIPWAESAAGDPSGRITRFYNKPEFVVTTIDNASEGTYASLTPTRVALYSRELYTAALEEAVETNNKDPERLTVTSLRFYESGFDPLPMDKRIYRRRFPGEGTRYVNYEIGLSYPRTYLGSPVTIRSLWSRDGPMAPHTSVLEKAYDENSTSSLFNQGVGNVDARQFSQRHGKWTIEFYINGQKIAVGSFEVY